MDSMQAPMNPPKKESAGIIGWVKANLFSCPRDIIITLILAGLLIRYLPGLFDWLFFSAVFDGSSRAECNPDTACWIPVVEYFDYYIYGPYPAEEHWRVNVGFFAGLIAFGLLFSTKVPKKIMVGYLSLLPFALWELYKGGLFLPEMAPSVFGGFMLTFFLGAIAMCLSLPVAVLLALGRQAKLPIIRCRAQAPSDLGHRTWFRINHVQNIELICRFYNKNDGLFSDSPDGYA